LKKKKELGMTQTSRARIIRDRASIIITKTTGQ